MLYHYVPVSKVLWITHCVCINQTDNQSRTSIKGQYDINELSCLTNVECEVDTSYAHV